MSLNKIVLKGTGRMSLHERFTKLKFDSSGNRASVSHKPIPVKSEVIHIEDEYRPTPRGRQAYSPPPRQSRPRTRTRTPDQPKYNTRRMRSLSPMSRMRQTISPAEPRRSNYNERNTNLFSTHRVNKKSVYLRLGVRPRSLADRMSSGIPVWAKSRQSNWERGGGGGGGGGWRMSRSASTQSLNRWSSQGSLNSYDIPRYQMNNRRFRGGGRGGYGGGGGRRNFAYNRAGRWRYGQGWFGRRRGGNRGGNRGNNRGGWTSRFRRPPPPKKEDLDAELDRYMAGTKGVLDRELDTYMSESKS